MKYEQWCDKNLKVQSRMGSEWLVLCPFHKNTGTASCCVNVSRGVFVCYSCGEKGGMSKLSAKVNKPLTAVFSSDEVRGQLAKFNTQTEETRSHSPEFLDQFTSRTHPYWEERGISPGLVRDWQLGYDPKTRAVTIPIIGVRGDILGVVRRFTFVPKVGPRYLYPKGFKISWHLFGAFMADKVPTKASLVVVEGSIDCLSMWEANQPSVALLGSSLHPHQLTILSSLGYEDIVLFLDDDDPGKHGMMKAAPQLLNEGFSVKVAQYPTNGGKDPGALSVSDRRRAVRNAVPYMSLRIGEVRGTVPAATPKRTIRLSGQARGGTPPPRR